MLGWLVIILLVILLISALPTWPYSGGWGYYPSGILALLLVILLVLLIFGLFPFGTVAPNVEPRVPIDVTPRVPSDVTPDVTPNTAPAVPAPSQ